MNANFNVFTEDGKNLLPLHEQAPIHLTRKLTLMSDGVTKSWIEGSDTWGIEVALKKGEIFGAIANNGKSTDLMVAFSFTQSNEQFCFVLLNAFDYKEETDEVVIPQTLIDALEIYIFGVDDIPASESGTGLEVYSEDGKELFSSAFPPMNALGKYEGSYWGKFTQPQGKSEDFSFENRTKIAVVCTCGIQYTFLGTNYVYETRSTAKFPAANKVTLSDTAFQGAFLPDGNNGVDKPFFWQRAWRFLLIDATNF